MILLLYRREMLERQSGEGARIKLHKNYVEDKYMAVEWEDEVSLMEITKNPLTPPSGLLTKVTFTEVLSVNSNSKLCSLYLLSISYFPSNLLYIYLYYLSHLPNYIFYLFVYFLSHLPRTLAPQRQIDFSILLSTGSPVSRRIPDAEQVLNEYWLNERLKEYIKN